MCPVPIVFPVATVFVLQWARVSSDGAGRWSSLLSLLGVEVMLLPFACAAIVPIGISAFSLSRSYLRAGMCDFQLPRTITERVATLELGGSEFSLID